MAEEFSGAGTSTATIEADSGLVCLTLLLAFHQIPSAAEQLRHVIGHGDPVDDSDLVGLAKRLGARAKAARIDLDQLSEAPLPAIARALSGEYFLIAALRDDEVLIQRAGQGAERLNAAQLGAIWSGRMVLVTTRASSGAAMKFDVTWFIPALVKYRWMLGDVLAASLVLQLFALATPLIFQVVIDKVLVHQGLTT
ncbi:cysteine peptidase family C39 domain-containing protein, partial [Brevundimonas sp.]|uniref:cysteine peptidase family C39 domain-containing protein n=1 Tax=Brevundimonas sp. TaxID=1871086 RepID=UPI003568D9EF